MKWRRAPLYVLVAPFWLLAMGLSEILEAGVDLTDFFFRRKSA